MKQSHIGHVGSCASVACAIHCIAMPFLITILPTLGIYWLASGWFELTALTIAIGFSLMSLCWGYKQHGRSRLFWLILAGTLWFLLGYIRHEHLYSFVGGGCMITANLMNHRFCTTCSNCEHE